MKTITARQFYHKPSLIDKMAHGDQILVASRGKPKFVVTKSGSKPPRMTPAILKERSVNSCKSMNSVEFLKDLRQ